MKFTGIAIAAAIVGLLVLFGTSLADFYDTVDTYADVVSIIRDIIVSLVAVVGTTLGLGEWQRQFNAKNEHELARRVIRAVYQLQNAIGSFRNPFVWGGEMHAAFVEAKKKGEVPKEFDEFIAALDMRFNKLREAVLALRGEHMEADVLWGRGESTKPITELLNLVHRLSVSYEQYRHFYHQKQIKTDPISGLPLKNPMQKYYEEQFEKYGKTVQGMDDDDFGKKVAKAVDDIEDWLRPKLKP